MGNRQWPPVLRVRLGDEGVAALAGVFEERDHAVLNLATDRFERHVSEESAKLRAEVREQCAVLRADFRVELAGVRADFIKWSFLFWVGQAVTIAGLLVALR